MLIVQEKLAAWRIAARAGTTLNEEELDEIETHLRDRIDALVADGSSPLAAFEAAAIQLGELARMDVEYRKVRVPARGRDRLLWMLCGYVVFEGVQLAARLAATFTVGHGFPGGLADGWAYVGLISIHATVITCLVIVVARGALGQGPGYQPRHVLSTWRRAFSGSPWPAAALTLASLLVFLASAVAIDYWQWWISVQHAGPSRGLGLTNLWLDVFEVAVAPTLAIAAVLLLAYSSRPKGSPRLV